MKRNEPKVFEALNWARDYLRERDREENAGYIAMGFCLQMERAELLANLHRPLSESEYRTFKEMIVQHGEGVPIQYVTGYEEFFGRKLYVSEHCLIPRPETEELVLGAIERMKTCFSDQSLEVVDIGTGSGAIAITLKLEMPELHVTATDISPKSLKIAKKNARQYGANIEFVEGDLLAPLIGKKQFDCIISNPPYIPIGEMDNLPITVKNYEPKQALFAGSDGLTFYRRIIDQLPDVMKKSTLIGFEIGHTQGKAVKELILNRFSNAEVEIIKDINGKQRMVFACIRR
ncbi:peptide chain release factor N(5)-glutamine methyltransferase [Fervidibacillus halotolerans]|uniref:Release factor glutamine methyltransferase n=1 Tax=Fervidibacillus halotolerans TaxID=2980027 RepID=A0A9E8LYQ3_9BACI|nr:peptide chain release factor N(5)-glutamine methyltransferase [Fervidibacillus halotolerans]WAA12190.1 peptide chain release factor N(5)-glutamine methyltransferase [Fervidibacillus halotolerans]